MITAYAFITMFSQLNIKFEPYVKIKQNIKNLDYKIWIHQRPDS